jgi:nucleoside-diphosphate kinase
MQKIYVKMSKKDFFIMLKPDALERGLVGEIISRFEKRGFKIKGMKMMTPSIELIKSHYSDHSSLSYYNDLIKFVSDGNIIAIKMNGNIDVARNIVGITFPHQSPTGSIRGDFSCSIFENLIHCSHDPEAAANELMLWSRFLELD